MKNSILIINIEFFIRICVHKMIMFTKIYVTINMAFLIAYFFEECLISETQIN